MSEWREGEGKGCRHLRVSMLCGLAVPSAGTWCEVTRYSYVATWPTCIYPASIDRQDGTEQQALAPRARMQAPHSQPEGGRRSRRSRCTRNAEERRRHHGNCPSANLGRASHIVNGRWTQEPSPQLSPSVAIILRRHRHLPCSAGHPSRHRSCCRRRATAYGHLPRALRPWAAWQQASVSECTQRKLLQSRPCKYSSGPDM